MAIDREATLKNAEKFLRVGRLDAAISEYARVVEDQPRDWNTANALGDLYIRAGQPERAVPLYRRIAEHLLAEGFYPKAAALFKKVLKIAPADDEAQVRLAEISAKQGLLADARAHYALVEARRRQHGDADGADEILVRLGGLDPEDLEARHAAAEAAERRGKTSDAAALYRALHDDYLEQGREEEAAGVLRQCLRLQPGALDAGLLLPLAKLELAGGRADAARDAMEQFLAAGGQPGDLAGLAWTLVESDPDAAAICAETAADAHARAGRFGDAADVLRTFAARAPGHVGVLLRLVEVCVDGGLDADIFDAQARLADAYLLGGRADEARVIAEDLLSRHPADARHTARLRRALEMLGVADVDAALAERASAVTDDLPVMPPEPSRDEPEPEAAPARVAVVAEMPKPAGPVATTASRAVGVGAPAVEGHPAGAVEIDLTTVLADLQGAAPAPAALAAGPRSLDDVFEHLRAEAAADEASDESAEHLGLATTYLEMGMPEDAIGSLEIAARSPRLRFVASAMLAQVHRDSSDLPRAIEWFERAAEAPAPSADEARSLLYDLGDVLETVGETARALAVFLELQTDHPGYRDVPERVARLSASETEG